MPAKEPKREFKVGDKIRVNLHHGKIEDAVVRAVVQDDDGTKLQVDVVGLDLTALIERWQAIAMIDARREAALYGGSLALGPQRCELPNPLPLVNSA